MGLTDDELKSLRYSGYLGIEAADEIESLRRDAERYRWLRLQHHNANWFVQVGREPINPGYLDATIDATMKVKP